MTFPTIIGITESTEAPNSTSHNVDLPPTIAAGDLICAIGTMDASTGTPTLTWDDVTAGAFTQGYDVLDTGNIRSVFFF